MSKKETTKKKAKVRSNKTSSTGDKDRYVLITDVLDDEKNIPVYKTVCGVDLVKCKKTLNRDHVFGYVITFPRTALTTDVVNDMISEYSINETTHHPIIPSLNMVNIYIPKAKFKVLMNDLRFETPLKWLTNIRILRHTGESINQGNPLSALLIDDNAITVLRNDILAYKLPTEYVPFSDIDQNKLEEYIKDVQHGYAGQGDC